MFLLSNSLLSIITIVILEGTYDSLDQLPEAYEYYKKGLLALIESMKCNELRAFDIHSREEPI